MSKLPVETSSSMAEELRKIPRFTRQYAQNRSVGMLIALGFFAVTFGGILGASYLLGEAYRSGNVLLWLITTPLLLVALAACIWLSLPTWGGGVISQLTARFYATQGNIGLGTAHDVSRRTVRALAGFLFVGIGLIVMLGLFDVLPMRLLQPASALFVVPFLVVLWLLMRPMVGYAMLLWPVLYGLHAAFILAGIPIAFASPWDWLNMLIPTVGYGLLTASIVHLIGQSSLRSLKKLTYGESADVNQNAVDL